MKQALKFFFYISTKLLTHNFVEVNKIVRGYELFVIIHTIPVITIMNKSYDKQLFVGIRILLINCKNLQYMYKLTTSDPQPCSRTLNYLDFYIFLP